MNLYTVPISRNVKQALLMVADALMLALAAWLAFNMLGIRLEMPTDQAVVYFALAAVISVAAFYRIGLYRALLLYMGLQSGFIVVQGVAIAALLFGAVYYLILDPPSPNNAIVPIFWMIALLFVGGSRFIAKLALQSLIQNFRPKEPVIIYGAGSSGMQLVAALLNGNQYLPVAFVDDSRHIIGSIVNGVRVYSPASLPDLINNFSVRQVLLAMPSVTHATRKSILNRLEHLPVHVKTVPELFDMRSGRLHVDQVRDIDIEDLLGRDIVPPDPELMGACISGRSVMVTGAAGSIGSELCRQIIALRPQRLILLDSFEFGLYDLELELQGMRDSSADTEIVAMLGNVCNRSLMDAVINRFSIETVYHVAAYKQVPMVEKNVVEGVYNNIFGTVVAAQAAQAAAVRDFVLISTDKAVRPTNVMGATKRFAEQILQALAATQSNTCFSMVRFGNVLGSSGSVVPLFRRQIAEGGPVTVTHPEVTRYFMTVEEAAQLVIQAGSMASGGEVFVLDMHDPIRIVDLARKMIHLMGYDVKDENAHRGDIAIEYSGLRPGEKLFEELLIGESVTGTDHPKIMRAEEGFLPWEHLQPMLDELHQACQNLDLLRIRELLIEAVDGFEPISLKDDPLWTVPDQVVELPAVSGTVTAKVKSAKVTPLHKRS
ncbi:polysaccharide biosynthesis protein [Pseudohongiella spirulinae]|uniref:Polysaccharide biosynthesis protein n=1 Tax=Pseudohongiella spirulinae TaxID=1249552 RepID=A0A0S2KD87_9GAMM|nr:nucleoside-diphosphate sugar epimerase/dehydratase [Pseudohongiella spirulinae]ALO46278.1 Polysaccharide biosynthesis protein [Pseudohongiella spirulinae]